MNEFQNGTCGEHRAELRSATGRCPRQVSSTGVSGQHDCSSTLFLMALFFRGADKYVFDRFEEVSLGHFDILTSS
jgi:hypothetical protein